MTASACSSGESTYSEATAAVSQTQPKAQAPTETFAPILERKLPNVPGKSFTSATVSFPPGSKAVPHRHGQAFVFAYVLEGEVRSRVDGGPSTTYHQGEFWVENPGAHHPLTENVSDTEPAKLLVTFVAGTGAELKIDDANATYEEDQS